MASESKIKAEIEYLVSSISVWTIGITDKPELAKVENRKPRFWYEWDADTDTIAQNVKKHFIDKGMRGGTGGKDQARHVYIFL